MSSIIKYQVKFFRIKLAFRKQPVASTSISRSLNTMEGKGNKEREKAEMEEAIKSKKIFSFLAFVKPDNLNDRQKAIHECHVGALKKGEELYTDPATGYCVLTRLAHLRRGECCGNACRHCPYNHKAVSKDMPRKTFNSAFFE